MLLFIGRSWNHLVPCFPSAPRGQWLPARPGDAEIDIAWTYNAEPQWDGGRCRVSSSGAASSSMVANIRGWNPDWMVRPQRGYQVGGSIGPLYQRHCRMTSGTATKLTEFRGPLIGRDHTRATPARSLMTSSSLQSRQDRFRLACRKSMQADRRPPGPSHAPSSSTAVSAVRVKGDVEAIGRRAGFCPRAHAGSTRPTRRCAMICRASSTSS
jgi:hypothetical protein